MKTGGRPPTFKPLPPSSQPLDHWANHCPGDDVIPAQAERVEWEGGLLLFCGTRDHPLVSFEAEQQARYQAGQQIRLWRVELINHERRTLDESRMVGTLVSPKPADLPRLLPWAASNGQDYWTRPWAYLDAPSGHPDVGVSSMLTSPSTMVTVAILVDCPHEPQFLPDMVVTQLASVAAGRATHQVWPLTQNGEIQGNLELEVAAKRFLPRGYDEDYSAAILDQLNACEAFHLLNMGRQENLPMPSRHVTPSGCPRAQLHDQTSRESTGRPVVTAKVAKAVCPSQATSSKRGTADIK